MKKKNYKSDEDYRYRGPKMTVMQPVVVNVDNVPASSERGDASGIDEIPIPDVNLDNREDGK